MGLTAEMARFVAVGVVAAAVHYGLLIGLVEGAGWRPVPATLMGYLGGGVVSYLLNRRLTYRSDRPHHEAGWRFATVALGGFLLTGVLMQALVERVGVPYLPAQLLTTLLVMGFSYSAHKLWSFRS